MRVLLLVLLFFSYSFFAQEIIKGDLNDLKVFIPGMNIKGEISLRDMKKADTLYLIGRGSNHFFLKSCEISIITRGIPTVYFANSPHGVKIKQIRPDKFPETKTKITLHKMRVFNLFTKKYCDIPSQTITVIKSL